MGENREYNKYFRDDCQALYIEYGIVVLCDFHTRDGGTYIHQDTKCVLTITDFAFIGFGDGEFDAKGDIRCHACVHSLGVHRYHICSV